MRIIGFSKKWAKLQKPLSETFTTFRFPWKNGFEFQVGDKVQLVFQPRSKEREILGVAEIVRKDLVDCSANASPHLIYKLTDVEAIADGFQSATEMIWWLREQYGPDKVKTHPMIKYTLKWIERDIP